VQSEASKMAETVGPEDTNIPARVAGLSPEKLRLLARAIKNRNAGIARQPGVSGIPISPLVPIRPSGPLSPLFLVHPVGGGVIAYHDLAKYLRIEQPVYALQNLDSGNQDERDSLCIEDMAARYIEAIQTVRPHGPYMLGGSSMGGAVAFEMAVQLNAQKQHVSLVAMLDTPARIIPHMQGQERYTRLAVELELLASIIASGRQKRFQLRLAELDLLHPEEKIKYVFNRLQQEQLVPASLSFSAFNAALKAMIKNLDAFEKYVPGTYDGHVAMIRAADVSPDMKESVGDLCADAGFGWQKHCLQPVTVRFVAGDHVLINLEPNVRFTGAELQRLLDEARES
jgi:thioesterase domain-containing protein